MEKFFFEHFNSTLLYNASRNVFYNSNLLHIKHYNNCKWNYKKRNPSPSLYLNSSYIFFVIIIHIQKKNMIAISPYMHYQVNFTTNWYFSNQY